MAKIKWKNEDDILVEKKVMEVSQKAQKSLQKQTEALNKFLLSQLDNMIYSGAMSEEEALEYVNAYPPFEIGVAYKAKDKIQYDGVVYEVIQAHTSQVDWLPNTVPALFKVYLSGTTEDGDQVIHDWVQPAGAHDAYKKGDVVMFNGKVYESSSDGNVWIPGVYGWKEILE